MIITPIEAESEQGRRQAAALLDRFHLADDGCRQAVTEVLEALKDRGDRALIEYIRTFDAPDFELSQLQVTREEIEKAYSNVDEEFKDTLRLAIERIQVFHQRQKEESWSMESDNGVTTGRLIRPVDSAGLYVPGGQGGKTPLVSSVLMNGIPASIAGVKRRVMVTPSNEQGAIHPALLVAANEIGISEIYKVGSSWAIGALAYGTETIPRVDVIVGPGNQFVTEAKRQVAGMVRIDMIAGPSEVLIIADKKANPAFIAADMLAQAEHDIQALSMLITTSRTIAAQVVLELEKQLEKLSRADIARTALADRGVILITKTLETAIELANGIAAEHLELMVEDPWKLVDSIRHAGAIFLGSYTPEAAGDYLAGPNHVLPTMGTARFSSALGVETFVKKSSIIFYSKTALAADSPHIQRLANLEGLTAHALSVKVRTQSDS